MATLIKKIIAAFFAGAIISCSTPYQPDGNLGGFSEIALSEDMYVVTFNGNAFTSAASVQEMTILRGAEIALENNFTHFIVLDEENFQETIEITTPGSVSSNTTGIFSANQTGNQTLGTFNANTNTTIQPPTTNTFNKPTTRMYMLFSDSNSEEVLWFDAQLIYNQLAQKYGLIDSREE